MKTLFLLVFAFPAFGAIKLATKVELNGSSASPTVIVKEGEWTSITQDLTVIRLLAVPTGTDAVTIRAEILENTAGYAMTLGKPTVITKWNEMAQVSSTNDQGKLNYRLSITPSQAR